MSKLNVALAYRFKQALIESGYSEPQLSMLMAQAAHETDGFNKKLAVENNNYAGIKYTPALSKIAAPSNNFFAPAKESPSGIRVPYAHFNDMQDFVKRWIPYAHLNQKRKGNKTGPPLNASSFADYAHRLKQNGYYQDPESLYLKRMIAWDEELQAINLSSPSSNQISKQKRTASILPLLQNNLGQIALIGSLLGPQGLILALQATALEKLYKLIKKSREVPYEDRLQRKHKPKIFKPLHNAILPITEPSIDIPFQIINPWHVNSLNYPILSPQPDDNTTITDVVSTADRFNSQLATNLSGDGLIKTGNISEMFGNDLYKTGKSNFYSGNTDQENTNAHLAKMNIPQHGNIKQMGSPKMPGKKNVNLHVNKSLIENLTINVRDAKEGINNIKHKVEEALLEIINSASIIS